MVGLVDAGERRPVSDAQMAVLALAAVGGVWAGWAQLWVVIATVVGVLALGDRRRRAGPAGEGSRSWPLMVTAAVVASAGAIAGERAWDRAQPRILGPFAGWAVVATDPAPVSNGIGVVLAIEGERFQTYAFGPAANRLERRQAGEQVEVSGVRGPLRDGDRWLRVRHVVGRFDVERVGARAEGAPLARASNRLRERLRSAAEATMAPADAALFTGLVVGDDVRQSREVIERFRAVGMSHLTAVSGQNVAFVLAVAGVLLRRLPPWWRLGATWAVIAWFVVLTRVEPSVVRAGTMAGLGALAFALGRDRSVPRILAIAVTVLVLVDPLLVWSVGFWLSCGATAGVSVVAPRLAARWRGPEWLAMPVATTVGAQLGVLVPSVLVFERLPVTGIVANLLAVPVAGMVMLVGMPAALIAAAAPSGPSWLGWSASMVMLPAELGTRWVATVAALAERLTPSGAWVLVGWVVQIIVCAWWWRPLRPAGDTRDGRVDRA